MNIDIELFKKNFKIDENCTSVTHERGKLYKVFPFTGNSNPNYIIKDMRNVVNGYLRNVCGIDKVYVVKDEILQKCCDNVKCSEDDKKYFIKLISSMFFDNNDELIPLNIIMRKYSNCESMEDKIANFLADVFGYKAEILAMIDDITTNFQYNVIDDFFIKELPSINSKEYSINYNQIINYTQKMFFKDIKYLMQDKELLDTHFVDLFELYYFDYVSQSCMKLSEFFNGDPDVRIPLYYALDWEKTTKDRKCNTIGWKFLEKDIKKIFSHQVVLEMINQNNINDLKNYYNIKSELSNDSSKDFEYSNQLKSVSDLYVNCIKDCGDLIKDLEKDNRHETKTETELLHLFNCVYSQFKFSTTKKRVNDACYKQFANYCKDNKLKSRGSLGFMLNLTQHNLVFLTKLAIGNNDTKRVADVFAEFENRGVYLDNISQNIVIKYYEKLNIIEKKSDSGDALYVKRIL